MSVVVFLGFVAVFVVFLWLARVVVLAASCVVVPVVVVLFCRFLA